MIKTIFPYSNEFYVCNKLKKFPAKVYSAVIMDDRVIVSFSKDGLKEVLKDFDYNRSTWCYDLEGNILWYVEKPYYIDKETGERVIYDASVGGVKSDPKTNKLIVYSYRGYELDPYTGELSNDFELR